MLYEGAPHNTGLTTLNRVLAAKSDPAPPQTVVDVGPVMSVVPPADLARVKVIKIDVEWHEIEVLRSLAPLFELGRSLSVFVEFTPHRDAPEAASEFAAALRGARVHHVPGAVRLLARAAVSAPARGAVAGRGSPGEAAVRPAPVAVTLDR